jgi:hypothetical protein
MPEQEAEKINKAEKISLNAK